MSFQLASLDENGLLTLWVSLDFTSSFKNLSFVLCVFLKETDWYIFVPLFSFIRLLKSKMYVFLVVMISNR